MFSKESDDTSIFVACQHLIDRIKSKQYKYETDGVIFTSKTLGVGKETSVDFIKITNIHGITVLNGNLPSSIRLIS